MIVATFRLRNLTKGAARYEETSSPAAIGTLYIRKDSLDGKVPETITVTVTED